MGLKRVVDIDFWTDSKVEDFSPEDKYFMLYLLTNPRSNLLGIYEFSVKQSSYLLGYSSEAVKVLLDRFENKYGLIRYSPETNEVAIKNFLKHSVIKGGKPIEDLLNKEIKKVKNKDLISYVFDSVIDFETLNQTVRKVLEDWKSSSPPIPLSLSNDNVNGYGYGYGVSYHDTYNDTYHDTQRFSPTDYAFFQNTYNEKSSLLPKCKTMTDKRKKLAREFLKTFSEEQWAEVCDRANRSEFLTGRNDRGWKADIDFLLRADKAAKILEGFYEKASYKDRYKEDGEPDFLDSLDI